MTDDICDRISELVDQQLAQPIVDDYSNNRYPKCPHCHRKWHGLPVTRRIAGMYAFGTYDNNYRVDTDDSEILCHGSQFIGPIPAYGSGGVAVGGVFLTDHTTATQWYVEGMMQIVGRLSFLPGPIWNPYDQRRWWRTVLPSDARYRHDFEPDTITITTGRDYEQTFAADNVRISHESNEVGIFQSNQPIIVHEHIVADVLSETPPRLVGTSTPLTAPGVIAHPDDDERSSYEYVIPNGEPITGYTLGDIESMRSSFIAPGAIDRSTNY